MSVFEQVAQGAPTTNANAWPVEITDGTNLLGVAAHPLRVDPTGTTTQPVSGTLSVSGNVTVVQPTAANLNATAVQGGTWTVRNQDGAGTNLTSTSGVLDSNLKLVGGVAISTGTGASGTGIPRVTVANDSKVQLWNGTNTAFIDAGGNQSVNLTEFAGSALSIGQKLMAASIPVAIASDQNLTVNVGAVYNNQTGTISSGTVPTSGGGTVSVISGIFTWSTLVLNFIPSGTIAFGGEWQLEGSIDNVNWTPLTGTLLSATPEQVTQYFTTGFVACSARYNLAGFPYIRIRTIASFTGTINISYALTTALGDETSFSKTQLIDGTGAAVSLPTLSQYADGSAPTGILYQSASTNIVPITNPQLTPASQPLYLFSKNPVIGDVIVVGMVVVAGTPATFLTAANLANMTLVDTNNISYTATVTYDTTLTQFGQAILIYVIPVTRLDSQGSLGFTIVESGGSFFTPTSLTLIAHEYQSVTTTGLTFAHSKAGSGTTITPPTPSGAGFPFLFLVTQTTGGTPIVPANAQSKAITPGWAGSDYALSGTSLGVITYGSVTDSGYDVVSLNLPIVSTGTVAMGYDYTNKLMHPLSIGSTGVVNTSSVITSGTVAATQSGTWTVGMASVSTIGTAIPASATLMGAYNTSTTNLIALRTDASGNLNVNMAAGGSANSAASATGAAVPSSADYSGIKVGANLVGRTGFTVGTQNAASVAIVDGSGNQITSLGGTQYANGTTVATPTGTVQLAQFSGTVRALQTDGSGNLNIAVPGTVAVTQSGTWTVGNASIGAITSASPTSATLMGGSFGGNLKGLSTDSSGNLLVSLQGAINNFVTPAFCTTAAPTYTNATNNFLSVDTAGNLRVTGTFSIPAVSTTGSAVPASAMYGGIKVGANLVGQTGLTVGSQNATAVALVDASGTQITSFLPTQYAEAAVAATATGTLAMAKFGTALKALQTDTSGSLFVNVATGGNITTVGSSVPAGITYMGANKSGLMQPLLTDSSGYLFTASKMQDGSGTAITSTGGSLNVNVTGGSASTTQYTSGTFSGTATAGVVMMGANGTGSSRAVYDIVCDSAGVLLPACQGISSTTAPTYSNGAYSLLSLNLAGGLRVDGSGVTQPVSLASAISAKMQDGSGTAITSTGGSLNVNITGGASGNSAASATGSAVPASADYQGVKVGANLLGATGFTVGSQNAQSVAIVDGSGNQITSFSGGTEYAEGAIAATGVGTLMMGKNSTTLKALQTDASGNLNINVVSSTLTDPAEFTAATTSAPSKIVLMGGKSADVTPVYNPVPLAAGSGSVVVSLAPTQTIAVTQLAPANLHMTMDVDNTVVNTTTTGSPLGSLNATGTIAMLGQTSVGMQLAAGTLIGTIIAEVTYDGTTWNQVEFIDTVRDSYFTQYVFTASNTATAAIIAVGSGVISARVRVSAYTSGTANVSLAATRTESGIVTATLIDGRKQTYRLAIPAFAPIASSTAPSIALTGSGTKVIKVTQIRISGTAGTGGVADIILRRLSVLNGGTAVSQTTNIAKMDTQNAAATATLNTYTAVATTATSAGVIDTVRYELVTPAVTVSPNVVTFNFSELPGAQQLIVRGTNDFVGLCFSAIATTPSVNVMIEWTEE